MRQLNTRDRGSWFWLRCAPPDGWIWIHWCNLHQLQICSSYEIVDDNEIHGQNHGLFFRRCCSSDTFGPHAAYSQRAPSNV